MGARGASGKGERGRGREGFGIEVEPLSHTKLCMPTAHGGFDVNFSRFWLAADPLIHYYAMLSRERANVNLSLAGRLKLRSRIAPHLTTVYSSAGRQESRSVEQMDRFCVVHGGGERCSSFSALFESPRLQLLVLLYSK